MTGSTFPLERVLWMPLGLVWQPVAAGKEFCCKKMAAALRHDCKDHETPWDCSDTSLVYHEPFNEYGVPIRDGGMSYLIIDHCPWCGKRLPSSERDRWFDEVEAASLDPQDIEALPPNFLSAAWRQGSSFR